MTVAELIKILGTMPQDVHVLIGPDKWRTPATSVHHNIDRNLVHVQDGPFSPPAWESQWTTETVVIE